MSDTQTTKNRLSQPSPDNKKPGTPRVAGSEFAADLGSYGVEESEHACWCGLLPDAPLDALDVAGLSFPKMNELLESDPAGTGRLLRRPVAGTINLITTSQLKLLRDRLRRTVIRTYDLQEQREEPGTGKNLGDPHTRRRRGHPISVPSRDEIEQARKDGRVVNPYVRQAGDVPAARYVYLQVGPRRETLPASIEESGIDWPETIA